MIPRFDGAPCFFEIEGSVTGQVRHGYAATKHAIRAVIQSSQATTAALSRDLGVNVKAFAKWRRRVSVEDRKAGATQPSSTVPNADEDAMIVAVYLRQARYSMPPPSSGVAKIASGAGWLVV